TWRMFRRLEAIDGRGPDVRLPQWLRWRTTTRTETTAFRNRHPLWLLATKELRLQQLAFVVAGLYVLGSLGVVSLSRLTPQQSAERTDRKSTRLNSSHVAISYAVFCLKKKIITGLVHK